MKQKYTPPSSADSPRFTGLSTYARLPYLAASEKADFGIVGVPFDLGCSFRSGPRFGPAAVREASRLIRRANPFHRIDVFEHLSGGDYGDTPLYPSDLERSLQSIQLFLAPLVKGGMVPMCIGGDHTIPLPILRALAKETGALALVHFDSHTDTDDLVFGTKINHGTTFRRALEERLIDPQRSIQIGIRGSMSSVSEIDEARALGFEVIEATEMFALTNAELVRRITRRVGKHKAYLTFDIDFLDPAYAPGTGTPEVGGPSTHQALSIIRGLAGINFVGFDLVEVSPPFDHGQITALAAANLIFEFISLLAVRRAKK
ncbi:MAG: agmatinase [Acidipila sp.]|nr:agmatinase [Acidipila sp.]